MEPERDAEIVFQVAPQLSDEELEKLRRILEIHQQHIDVVRLVERFLYSQNELMETIKNEIRKNPMILITPPNYGVYQRPFILPEPLEGTGGIVGAEAPSEKIDVLEGLEVSVAEDKIIVSAGKIKVGEKEIEVPEVVFEKPDFPAFVVVDEAGRVDVALLPAKTVVVLAEVS